MRVTKIEPAWETIPLEEGFTGTLEYRMIGKTLDLRFRNITYSQPDSSQSRVVGTLPSALRPHTRKLGFISATTSLNNVIRVWVEGATINLMPGINSATTWGTSSYTGQVSFNIF
ncbi:hypothetical protein [Corynebacterium glutamicum]|uniref:hypothetical protein n=1 Tax=Corynebacterium glutamicum TaxID=1718 RepID=UPI001B8B114C|nr:hypothetical protein [Corynebacterium glutamicum]